MEDLNKYKVTELKEMLKGSGLKVSGRKSELVERLLKSQEIPMSPVSKTNISLPMSPVSKTNISLSPLLYSSNELKVLPKDVVFKIMDEMDDRSLFNFCKINNQRDVKGVLYCNNEDFWRRRIFEKYGEIYPENTSWKDFYLRLSYYLNKYDNKDNAFILASVNGHLDILKYLLTLKIRPNAFNNQAIAFAAENGRLEVIKYLISLPKKYKINPAVMDNYAIRLASSRGHLEVVKYLISLPEEYRINPSANDNFAIKYASANGHTNVVKYLLKLPKKYKINPSVWKV